MTAIGIDDVGAASKNEASDLAIARRLGNSPNCLQKISTIWSKLSAPAYRSLGHRVRTVEPHTIA